ncbi:radical SAM protein [Candidatus Parcubacteria bacterium]|nr:radical SAM protein [Candidatus Parcubacteria bacterium]
MTDVLLINPPSPNKSIIIRDLNRSGRTSKEQIIWPQTNMAYLAAMLPDNLSVEIIDCIAERMSWPEFLKLLNNKKPRYVVSHVITSTATNDLRVFKEAKKLGAITITMGPHVTELTENTLKENPDLDFIMTRECDYTFKELINALENKQTDLSDIKGLAWKQGDRIIKNENRPYIENLDELPLPRHDLLPIEKYVFPFMASEFTFVVSGRGCPYPCAFCRQPIMWEKKVRLRSAQSIMKELRMLKKLGVNNFIFHSDTFTVNMNIVKELCEMMVDEKLNLTWACNSRVDTVDKETLKLMKKAGCWMIAYGFESGSQAILDKCEKKATVEQGKKIAQITHDIGIKVYGYFIIGLLGETKETIEKTINFAKSNPITFAIFHVASPFPGTKFYKQVKENNWLTNEQWEATDQGGNSPVDYPELSGEEIMQGIKRAYRSFYLRPKAVINIFGAVRNYNDIKHLISAGVSQLLWK